MRRSGVCTYVRVYVSVMAPIRFFITACRGGGDGGGCNVNNGLVGTGYDLFAGLLLILVVANY